MVPGILKVRLPPRQSRGNSRLYWFSEVHMSAATQARRLITSAPSKTRVEARGFSAGDKFDLEKARQGFGLTQRQLARTLNLSAQTLQHLEPESGTNETNRRIRDLREFLLRMDEYVVVSQENRWLSSSLEIFVGVLHEN